MADLHLHNDCHADVLLYLANAPAIPDGDHGQ